MHNLPNENDLQTELMIRFRNGDESAFSELVDQFKSPIYNFVLRQVGNESDAEDIAQNVFVQIFKNAPHYRPTAKLTTWIFTIARNLCLNEFRRRKRHPVASLDEMTTESDENIPTQFVDSHSRTSSEEVIQREFQDRLLIAIRQLPEAQRSALLLCCQEHLSYEEIAKVLKTSVSATKSLIYRARETLQKNFPRP